MLLGGGARRSHAGGPGRSRWTGSARHARAPCWHASRKVISSERIRIIQDSKFKNQYAWRNLRQIRTRRPADTSTRPCGPHPCGAVVRSAPTLAACHTRLYGEHKEGSASGAEASLIAKAPPQAAPSSDQPRPIGQLGGSRRHSGRGLDMHTHRRKSISSGAGGSHLWPTLCARGR